MKLNIILPNRTLKSDKIFLHIAKSSHTSIKNKSSRLIPNQHNVKGSNKKNKIKGSKWKEKKKQNIMLTMFCLTSWKT
jgi:hypothetical protein